MCVSLGVGGTADLPRPAGGVRRLYCEVLFMLVMIYLCLFVRLAVWCAVWCVDVARGEARRCGPKAQHLYFFCEESS